jgi:hypothetical protein
LVYRKQIAAGIEDRHRTRLDLGVEAEVAHGQDGAVAHGAGSIVVDRDDRHAPQCDGRCQDGRARISFEVFE